MNAREALGDDRPHAEVDRGQGRLLPRAALAVVVTRHHEAACRPARALVEVAVDAAEHEPGAGGDVSPQGHPERPVRRHVARRDVVADDDQNRTLERFLYRFAIWRVDDVGTAREVGVEDLRPPGVTVRSIEGCTVRSRSAAPTVARSS
jgi:hypothetical protein